MKLKPVLVASMVVAGLGFASASAHASPILDVGICLDRDGSCAQAASCATDAQCNPGLLGLGAQVCDAVAHKCVTKCVTSFVSSVVGGLLAPTQCQDATAPQCSIKGLCICADDAQCSDGRTCSQLLHRCVVPLSLPDAGISFPSFPDLPVGGGAPTLPTTPSAPGSSSGGTTPDGSGAAGGGTSSGSASPSGGSAASGASASASYGDAGLDADTVIAADGGCSTGGHGSGATFLGVLGAAFAFATARRRRH